MSKEEVKKAIEEAIESEDFMWDTMEPCPKCGELLKYDAHVARLKCPSCGFWEDES